MDTVNRSSFAVQVRDTIIVFAIATTLLLVWRTVLGQDDGVLILLQRLF